MTSRWRGILRLAGALALAGLLAACTHLFRGDDDDGAVLRVRDGRRISYGRLAEEVKGSDLVFVGENHNNAAHHAAQLRIIDELHWREVPLALGLEMFPAQAQPELDAWLTDRLSDTVFKSLYQESWRMPWELYGTIFQRARTWKIPLVGINVPRRVVQKVFKSGFDSLTPEERLELPTEVSCRIDPGYREFIRRSFGRHAGKGGEFEHFCEAQMLWTKGMALHLTNYLDSRPGRMVVVLAGASHALRKGIPEQIATGSRYDNIRIVLPELTDLSRETVTVNEADYLILDLSRADR